MDTLFESLIVLRTQIEEQIDRVNSIVNISELEKTAETNGLYYALNLINNLIEDQLI